VQPDPAIERICGSWAMHADAGRAATLGIPRDEELDPIVQAYVEDYL
jgi:hypothetical protein